MKKINPYRGIYSYTVQDKNDFYGRNREINSITDIIMSNVSTILTGYSGCGKTSLLQAGILPRLTMSNYHVISITPRTVYSQEIEELSSYSTLGDKIDNTNKDVFFVYDFFDEINNIFNQTINKLELICKVDDEEIDGTKTTLWEKMYSMTFLDAYNNIHYFVIVMDQFEELFQFGLNVKHLGKLFSIYQILCGTYTPMYSVLYELINFEFKAKEIYTDSWIFPLNSDVYDRYYSNPTYNRFVISLRKDFLFDLQSYSDRFPILIQNVNYIEHLSDEQARIVITKPEPLFENLKSHKITECIIGRKDFDDKDGLTDHYVDTLTLSIVMYKLWEECDKDAKKIAEKYKKELIENNKDVKHYILEIEFESKYNDVFKEKVEKINQNIQKNNSFLNEFYVILSDFYRDRIDSLKYLSKIRREEKRSYITRILDNHSNLSNIRKKIDDKICKDFIIDSYNYNTKYQSYSDDMIGDYLDKILFDIDEDGSVINYIKDSIVENTAPYNWKSTCFLNTLLPMPQNNDKLQDKLNILMNEKNKSVLQAAREICEMAYGDLNDDELDYKADNIIRSVRQVLVNNLKSISLIDAIKRCVNPYVKGKLLHNLDNIICDLQGKLLSDSGLYRQSVYFDDICELFDTVIYGKIEFERKKDWFCQLIKNDFIDICNGLYDICDINEEKIINKLTKSDIENILKDKNFTFWKDCIKKVNFERNQDYSSVEKEVCFLDDEVIDKEQLCAYILKYYVNVDFEKNYIYENNISYDIYNLRISLSDNRALTFLTVRVQDVLCYLIKYKSLPIKLFDSKIDEKTFRSELNKYVYRTEGDIDGVNTRGEIALVIKNCKLFTMSNKGSEKNVLEFRHDRLCEMAKKNIDIYKSNRKNAKRFTPDIYFTPQGRLKENNCYVEWFLGPWNTYSTVMSSMYFLRGDMGNIEGFDTDCISNLKRINYDNASSSIVTIALNERFGKNKYEDYHCLPAYFTHFRVKVEDNKIYNISFERRENHDSNVKKVVISTGFHKVRFYYDKYDRIILKEFCVRKDEHKDFYELDAEESNIQHSELPRDVRVKLPEVGYNAIYYKYNKISYKCPSETYFLNIKLDEDHKDLRVKARNEIAMSEFYRELDADIELVKDLKQGQTPIQPPKYVVQHIVDGNYGYKSMYDKSGRETSRTYVGGTKYGFNMIKFKYDDSDNVKSIAFFCKELNEEQKSIEATYHYPYKTEGADDSNIHKIELESCDSESGICKKTKYFDKNNEPCYDNGKYNDKDKYKLTGKQYTYTYEILNKNQYDTKRSLLKTLMAEYLWEDDDKVDSRVINKRVKKMIISQFEDINSAVVSIESFNANGGKIDGRRIVKDSNIYDYKTQEKGDYLFYHRIEFKYTRGIVKTHIFTKNDKKQYKFFINRHGNVIEKVVDETTKSISLKDISFEMIFVQGGEFKMGHKYVKCDYPYRAAEPVHNVRINDFYIGKTPVTYQLWSKFMKDMGIEDSNSLFPVVNVTWNDVCKFIERLNKYMKRHNEKLIFRLPTEAEWEYAARGGKDNSPSKYSGSNYIDEVALCKDYKKNDPSSIKPTKPSDVENNDRMANSLGIKDMSGNVKEWCSDYFGVYFVDDNSDRIADNPVGPSIGYARVVRGGGFKSEEYTCRVYNRDCSFPDVKKDDIGFRLVLEIEN